MATFDTSRTTYGTASAVNRIAAFVTETLASAIAWNDARVTRKALFALTDRELEDIGLVRGDIEYVTETTFIR